MPYAFGLRSLALAFEVVILVVLRQPDVGFSISSA